jgi:class 3 adenylate cyclase
MATHSNGISTAQLQRALADLALDIRNALAGLADPKGLSMPVRIGIASGPVVAGVVGTRKFFYDVWGDAVNTASRIESTSELGKIQVAPKTRELLADASSSRARCHRGTRQRSDETVVSDRTKNGKNNTGRHGILIS